MQLKLGLLANFLIPIVLIWFRKLKLLLQQIFEFVILTLDSVFEG